MKNSPDLTVLLGRLARVLQNEMHANGLKPTQWEALRYLARANRFSRTPSGLTAYLGMTKGTVSQTLIALERKGLVTKKADRADRRQVRIDLTAKGRRMLGRDPLEQVLLSSPGLSAKKRRETEKGLEALLTETLQQRKGRPFGVCESCRFFRRNHPDGAPHRCGLLDVALSVDDATQICVEQEPAVQ